MDKIHTCKISSFRLIRKGLVLILLWGVCMIAVIGVLICMIMMVSLFGSPTIGVENIFEPYSIILLSALCLGGVGAVIAIECFLT